MSDQAIQAQRFMVRIREPKDGAGGLVFTFVPKGIRQARRPEEQRQRVPRHIVRVRENGGAVSLDWKGTADDPGAAKSDMESEVHQRITERAAWLNLISELVGRVEQWVKELGWSTRRLDKQLDDPRIGKHTVPALLLQEDTVRVLLEPVSRDSIGGEGLVEFSLMPAYDDIASLYYRDGNWHLHYIFPNGKPVATVRSAEAKPLSKDTLGLVLGEMKKRG